jgi:hypothetical protein
MASYNEIISILDQFATAHYQIKAFGNGEMDELVETFSLKDAEYPKMWANDQPNTTATGEETFKFRIYMVDQVATLKQKTDTTLGESNINEVKSNTRQMCLDLVSFLIQNTIYPEITTDRNIQLTSFVDSFNDKLTGWYFDLDIRQALSFSACVIPMTGILPPPSTTCEPAIININGTFFINVPSGSTENIDVKDTNGLAVGSEVGGEWIVPPAGAVCDDAIEIITDSASNVLYTNSIPSGDTETQIITDCTNTLNGGAISGILAEGTKAITLKDTLGVTIAPTVSVNTLTNLDLVIPAVIPVVGVSTSVLNTGQETEYLSGDDGSRFQAGDYASVNMADISDFYTLVDNNEWGHKKRLTGDTGGYMDEVTGLFYDVTHVLTTKAGAFPNDILRDYSNRRRWYLNRSGARAWDNCVTLARTESKGGETGWYCPNRSEYESLVSNNTNSPTLIDSRLFNWSSFTMWCSTTFKGTVTQSWRFVSGSGAWTLTNKTTIVAANSFIKTF